MLCTGGIISLTCHITSTFKHKLILEMKRLRQRLNNLPEVIKFLSSEAEILKLSESL